MNYVVGTHIDLRSPEKQSDENESSLTRLYLAGTRLAFKLIDGQYKVVHHIPVSFA